MKVTREIKKVMKDSSMLIVGSFGFLGQLAISTKHEWRDDLPHKTAATDGVTLFYDPDFIVECIESQPTRRKQVAVVGSLKLHEIVHIWHAHPERGRGKDMYLWNLACDIWIHNVYPAMFTDWILPPGGVQDASYKGMIEEEIYLDLLKKNENENPTPIPGHSGSGQGGDGNSTNMPQPHSDMVPFKGTASEAKASIAAKRTKVMVAVGKMKKAGNIPGELARSAEGMGKAKVPWQRHLRRKVYGRSGTREMDYMSTNFMMSDYGYSQGFIMPGHRRKARETVVVIVDVSGSVSSQLMKEMAVEINSISKLLNSETYVIPVDTVVQDVKRFRRNERIVLKTKGGGGTDFRPGFEYIEDNRIKADKIIYITDGYCNSFPDKAPRAKTVWCLMGGSTARNFKPPFGEVIVAEENTTR